MSSLYQNPLDEIIASVKTLNGVVIDTTNYTYSTPIAITEEPDGNNSQLTVTSKNVQATYDGSSIIKFRRRPLSDLQTLIPTSIQVYGISTIAGFLTKLNDRFGLNLTTADVADGPLVLDEDGNGTILLAAVQTSLGWIGSQQFTLSRGDIPLSTAITVASLPGLDYPNQDRTKPFGEMYSYWRDCSAWAEQLAAITAHQSDLGALATLLTTITGNTWVTTGSSRYSLEGSEVTYNGVVSGDPTLKTWFERGLVVQLGAACLGYSGKLYLHYNMPDGFD